MKLCIDISLLLALVLLLGGPFLAQASPETAAVNPGETTVANQPTILGIKDSKFTLNGQPTFLLGASYYGGLGAPEAFIHQDLSDLKHGGFNWIRVWANWGAFGTNVSAFDSEGNPREPFLSKLQWLVAECDRRGMMVDVTLTRGDGGAGQPQLLRLVAHRRAVETVVTALKTHRNWYLDLSNERNIRDKRFTSMEDLKDLRQLARRLAPDLLVTASHGSDIEPEELTAYLKTAAVDFITPHRPRDKRSPGQTESATKDYLSRMRALGRIVPVLYHEPFRRDYGNWPPAAEDFSRMRAGRSPVARLGGVCITAAVGIKEAINLGVRSICGNAVCSTNSMPRSKRPFSFCRSSFASNGARRLRAVLMKPRVEFLDARQTESGDSRHRTPGRFAR